MDPFHTGHDLAGREQGRRFCQGFPGIGQVDFLVFPVRLIQQQRPEIFQQLRQDLLHFLALFQQLAQGIQGPGKIFLADPGHQFPELFPAHQAQDLSDRFRRHRTGHDTALVQQAQGIPEPPVRLDGHETQSFRFRLDMAAFGHLLQVFRDFIHRGPAEIEPLTPGQDGVQDFLGFRGSQDEHHMFRRFLQGFQQRIEGVGGDHVDFVDDVHLVAAGSGSKIHLLPEFPDFIDAPVGRGVDFHHIPAGPLRDFPAVAALIAGMSCGPLFTVQGLGQDPGRTGLPGTPGTGKQIGMGNSPGFQGVGQSFLDGRLPHQIVKILGAPGPVQCYVCHRSHPFCSASLLLYLFSMDAFNWILPFFKKSLDKSREIRYTKSRSCRYGTEN